MFSSPKLRKRRWLRASLGAFDDRAVLILDGLKCHVMEPFVQLLRDNNVTIVVLVAHSSHMTQPLDVGIFWRVKNLIRAGGKYRINLDLLDRELADQTEAENRGQAIPPERGRLLADYVLNILRSFEQATVPDNVVSAFAQVGVHSMLVDRTNINQKVTYTDPATARLVVADFGVIPLLGERRAAQAPTWQLKISELNSLHQSPMARQFRRELEVIRAALAPPPEPASDTTPHSPPEKQEELPAAAVPPPGPEHPELPVPQRLLPVPPPVAPEPPAPPASQPRSALLPAPALRSAELVRHPLPTHSQTAATKSYRGAATPR